MKLWVSKLWLPNIFAESYIYHGVRASNRADLCISILPYCVPWLLLFKQDKREHWLDYWLCPCRCEDVRPLLNILIIQYSTILSFGKCFHLALIFKDTEILQWCSKSDHHKRHSRERPDSYTWSIKSCNIQLCLLSPLTCISIWPCVMAMQRQAGKGATVFEWLNCPIYQREQPVILSNDFPQGKILSILQPPLE